MTGEWPLGIHDKDGRKDFHSQVMFELRFEDEQTWQKGRGRSRGCQAVGEQEDGHEAGEALARSISHSG